MNDNELIARIGKLVDEEHQLERSLAGKPEADADSLQRLSELEVALDQCWDLLRQRRARRAIGEDPNAAEVRDASTVERYQQ